VRSELISLSDYLELVGRGISTVLRGSGRHKQSVAESSFDAWIKYYRQDENSPNAIVSYYVKGSLVGLALDLKLRHESQASLDDVMRALWQRYGQAGVGVPEDGIRHVAEEVSGLDLAPFFASCVDGTEDLPLAELLGAFAIKLNLRASDGQSDKGGKPAKPGSEGPKPALGAKIAAGNEARLTQVYAGGAAQQAGLSAGDVIVAADGIRVTDNLERLVGRRTPGGTMKIHAFRRDELMRFDLPLVAALPDTCWLTLDDEADSSARSARARWLGEVTNS